MNTLYALPKNNIVKVHLNIPYLYRNIQLISFYVHWLLLVEFGISIYTKGSVDFCGIEEAKNVLLYASL